MSPHNRSRQAGQHFTCGLWGLMIPVCENRSIIRVAMTAELSDRTPDETREDVDT
jgi:hypothetical protein